MFKESLLDKILYRIKKLIPKRVFNFFAPMYHTGLAWAGAMLYGYPSKSLKVIGVTGTKGKSTTVFLISKIFVGAGIPVAAIGSLGFLIAGEAGASSDEGASRARSEGGERSRSPLRVQEWPNHLKMTMPGRFKLQKFFYKAKKAGCEYVILEVTSEGIKQKRHLGIDFDCAVFTNIHKEHLESHGSFENYYHAKQELFKRTSNIHVLNADDQNVELFSKFSSKRTIFYGLEAGDMRPKNLQIHPDHSSFELYGIKFDIKFRGRFNVSNCLAALATGAMYGLDLPKAKPALEAVTNLPGRMEFIQKHPFGVVVDYAHTPDSLEAVYKNLKTDSGKLICVLGAAGGGRDKWKRPEFGRIADQYCDEIILTDEDPYDEDPEKIIEEVRSGIHSKNKVIKVLDRKEAIKTAIGKAKEGDMVVITGKGSEVSVAVAGGRKIPWSDREIVREFLK